MYTSSTRAAIQSIRTSLPWCECRPRIPKGHPLLTYILDAISADQLTTWKSTIPDRPSLPSMSPTMSTAIPRPACARSAGAISRTATPSRTIFSPNASRPHVASAKSFISYSKYSVELPVMTTALPTVTAGSRTSRTQIAMWPTRKRTSSGAENISPSSTASRPSNTYSLPRGLALHNQPHAPYPASRPRWRPLAPSLCRPRCPRRRPAAIIPPTRIQGSPLGHEQEEEVVVVVIPARWPSAAWTRSRCMAAAIKPSAGFTVTWGAS